MRPNKLALWLVLLAAGCATATEPTTDNVTVHDTRLASSGAVTGDDLAALADAGFQRVVSLAGNDETAGPTDEAHQVAQLGMGFARIPVASASPTREDFERFAAAMRAEPDERTLVHCGSNRRASSFAMLYRGIYEDVPLADAKADLNAVWVPNETWTTFIRNVLESYDIDPDCAGCDWTPSRPDE